jgi:pyruvate kinase
MFESATRNAIKTGYIEKGDIIVLSAGVPIGQSGNTNLIKVQQV